MPVTSAKEIPGSLFKASQENTPSTFLQESGQNREEIHIALQEVSQEYGLEPSQVDLAIRAWGRRTQDLYEKGLVALYEKNYAEATQKLSQSRNLRKQELVNVDFFLGVSLYNQGRYQEAVEVLLEAARLDKTNPQILSYLGRAFANTGDLAHAEETLKQVVETQEKTLGSEHPDLAQSLNNLGVVYGADKKYAQAEAFFGRALRIQEKVLGNEHPDRARTLNNLALVYRAERRYDEAESLYKDTLRILEKVLGGDDPDVAGVLTNLAVLYQISERGKREDVESLNTRALRIREKKLGREHPDLVENLGNLAALYWAEGRRDEAKSFYMRALSICEKKLGPNHPITRAIQSDLSRLQTEMEAELPDSDASELCAPMPEIAIARCPVLSTLSQLFPFS